MGNLEQEQAGRQPPCGRGAGACSGPGAGGPWWRDAPCVCLAPPGTSAEAALRARSAREFASSRRKPARGPGAGPARGDGALGQSALRGDGLGAQAPTPPAGSPARPEPRGPAAWSAAELDMGRIDGGSMQVTEDGSELTCHSWWQSGRGPRSSALHVLAGGLGAAGARAGRPGPPRITKHPAGRPGRPPV